jgi:hypothetical protein
MGQVRFEFSELSVYEMIASLNRGSIQIPFYQRKYSWVKTRAGKEVEFIKFLHRNRCLTSMIILDRQADNKDTRFILDGMHRLKCLQRFFNLEFEVEGVVPRDIEGIYIKIVTGVFESDSDRLEIFNSLNTTSTKMETSFVQYVTNNLTDTHPTQPVFKAIRETENTHTLNAEERHTQRHVLYQNLCQFLLSYSEGVVKENPEMYFPYTPKKKNDMENIVYDLPEWVYKAVEPDILSTVLKYLILFQSPSYKKYIKNAAKDSKSPIGKYLALLLGKIFYEGLYQKDSLSLSDEAAVLKRLIEKASAKKYYKVKGANQLPMLLKMVWE